MGVHMGAARLARRNRSEAEANRRGEGNSSEISGLGLDKEGFIWHIIKWYTGTDRRGRRSFLNEFCDWMRRKLGFPYILSFSHLRKLLPKAFLRSPSRAVATFVTALFFVLGGVIGVVIKQCRRDTGSIAAWSAKGAGR
jgi:hypothetical protein